MTDPRSVLDQARRGPVPADWRVFTKKRGKISGFFRGTSHDPDPLLVITPVGLIEYENERKPLTIVNFHELSGISLRVHGHSFDDSSIVTITVWVDLDYYDGRRKAKWHSKTFWNDLAAVQAFIEAFGAHKALRGLRGH